MFNLVLGILVGVALAGAGIVTLPKLFVWFKAVKAKYFTKTPVVLPVTTPVVTASTEVK